MNYRHAYHAGNHTEVFKHAALVLVLEHLRRKAGPFMVLDTHAGIGLYDLRSPEAMKTGEADAGVRAILASPPAAAAPYLATVSPFMERGLYPGSPAIVAGMLRDGDRLVACELHPDDAAVLRANFRGDPLVAVHHRDGYEAMLAFVPPAERRGLVLVDPPFEQADEAERLGRTLLAAVRKWPTGIYAAWYPIKDDRIGRAVARPLVDAGVPRCLRAELLRHRQDGERLAGGGMIFVNPPWRLDEALRRLGEELLASFAASEGRSTVEWLTRAR